MPNLLTHYLCGKETINKLSSKNLLDIINKNENSFNLGTQGPDILLYHNPFPWQKDKLINYLGGKIHDMNVKEFFRYLILYIINCSSNEQDVLVSYFLGFLCHYALDTTAHPYVFYMSGFDKDGKLENSEYINYHRRFETNIDCIYSMKYFKKPVYKLEITKFFQIKKEEKNYIGKMLANSAQSVYKNEYLKGSIVKSINDFIMVIKILNDSTGFKKILLSKIESKFKIKERISEIIFPKEINNNIDYLNENKNKWTTPWNKNKEFEYCFDELFDKAVFKSLDLFKEFETILTNSYSVDSVLCKIGENSYSTGENCKKKLVFKYHKCVFE